MKKYLSRSFVVTLLIFAVLGNSLTAAPLSCGCQKKSVVASIALAAFVVVFASGVAILCYDTPIGDEGLGALLKRYNEQSGDVTESQLNSIRQAWGTDGDICRSYHWGEHLWSQPKVYAVLKELLRSGIESVLIEDLILDCARNDEGRRIWNDEKIRPIIVREILSVLEYADCGDLYGLLLGRPSSGIWGDKKLAPKMVHAATHCKRFDSEGVGVLGLAFNFSTIGELWQEPYTREALNATIEKASFNEKALLNYCDTPYKDLREFDRVLISKIEDASISLDYLVSYSATCMWENVDFQLAFMEKLTDATVGGDGCLNEFSLIVNATQDAYPILGNPLAREAIIARMGECGTVELTCIFKYKDLWADDDAREFMLNWIEENREEIVRLGGNGEDCESSYEKVRAIAECKDDEFVLPSCGMAMN